MKEFYLPYQHKFFQAFFMIRGIIIMPSPSVVTPDLESSFELYTHLEASTTSNNGSSRNFGPRRGAIYPTALDTPLDYLFRMTDIILIISAVIFAISIAVVFSVVALAMIRVFSIKEYHDHNISSMFHQKIQPENK